MAERKQVFLACPVERRRLLERRREASPPVGIDVRAVVRYVFKEQRNEFQLGLTAPPTTPATAVPAARVPIVLPVSSG